MTERNRSEEALKFTPFSVDHASDDNGTNRPIVQAQLANLQLQSVAAPSGLEALDDARGQPVAPAATAIDAEPAVDLVRLLQITCADPSLFREITGEYLEQAEEILALMRLALDKPDHPEIQRLAHKLGGSSACCGMVAIMPPLAKLEQMPEDIGPVFVGDHIREASAQLKNIQRFLTGYSQTFNSVP